MSADLIVCEKSELAEILTIESAVAIVIEHF